MKDHARYVKIVERSEEDQCFVGSCPGLFYGGCHGDNEQEVFAELCDLVAETIEVYKREGKALPPPTSGRDYANKMVEVVQTLKNTGLGPMGLSCPIFYDIRGWGCRFILNCDLQSQLPRVGSR